jgi:predicted nucleic acid-binding protein
VTVVDASVLIAAERKGETGHRASRTWLRRVTVEGSTLAAPSIVLPEIAAALARATGDVALANESVQRFRRDLLVIEPVTESLAARAAEIAAVHGIRGCDAVYVALAERRGEDLVTLDRHQLERGSAVVPTCEPA